MGKLCIHQIKEYVPQLLSFFLHTNKATKAFDFLLFGRKYPWLLCANKKAEEFMKSFIVCLKIGFLVFLEIVVCWFILTICLHKFWTIIFNSFSCDSETLVDKNELGPVDFKASSPHVSFVYILIDLGAF